MPLFDTHCHLTDPRFHDDLPQVISRMRQAGVDLAVVVGDGAQDPTDALALSQAYPFLYAAAGVHPHDASCWDGRRAALLQNWLKADKMVALGEIGLDYHYDLSPRPQQRAAFDEQLEMAYCLHKPAILHIREAHGDAESMLAARYRAGRLPLCVMHCYSGSWESAKAYLNMGLYLSFTGSVTFKNAAKLPEVATKMPLERLMVETDCPYMAPVPLRGRRNEPAYVAYTAERIAQLRGMDPQALSQAAYDNGKRFFGIEGSNHEEK